ncbi:MAG: hypothetical protein ACRD4X_14535 [Candidatus Acidiferrales bacterium]
MSLTGILAGGLLNLLGAQPMQSSGAANTSGSSPSQSAQQEFQQLGQDLQSGNLSAARQDFAAIEQSTRQRTSQILHHHHHFSAEGAQPASTSSLSQDFGTLAQALQSGNLSAAQSAFTILQQAIEPSAALDSGAAAAGSQPPSNAINFLI